MVLSPQVYFLSCTQGVYKKNNFTAAQMKNKHVIVDERFSHTEKKATSYLFFLIDIRTNIKDCVYYVNADAGKDHNRPCLVFCCCYSFFPNKMEKPVGHVE